MESLCGGISAGQWHGCWPTQSLPESLQVHHGTHGLFPRSLYVHETLGVFMLLFDLHFCSSHSWYHLRLSEIAGLGPVTRTATEAFVFPLFLLPSSSKLNAFPLKACHVSPPRMSASKCVFGGRAQLGSFWGAVEFFSPCRP